MLKLKMRYALAAVIAATACGKSEKQRAAEAAQAAEHERWMKQAEADHAARAKTAHDRSDFLGLAQFVSDAAKGQKTTTALAGTFAAEALQGYEPQTTEPKIERLENGTVTFKGRSLNGGLVRVSFTMINKQAGEKRSLCLVHAAVDDTKEFQTWRNVMTWRCEETKASAEAAAWKKENDFKPLVAKDPPIFAAPASAP